MFQVHIFTAKFKSRQMQRLFVFMGLFSALNWGHSQAETINESLRIKAKELARKDENSPSLFQLSPIRGLTNKDFQITMGIPPIDGFSKKESGITTERDVVDPSWDIKQKFNENKKDVSKYNKDYYLGDIKTKSKYIRIVCRDHVRQASAKSLRGKHISGPHVAGRRAAHWPCPRTRALLW